MTKERYEAISAEMNRLKAECEAAEEKLDIMWDSEDEIDEEEYEKALEAKQAASDAYIDYLKKVQTELAGSDDLTPQWMRQIG